MNQCHSVLYSLHKLKKQNGSTIVEAIVAMFVLSFGVLALMLAQITAVHTSINAANQGEVTRAVQNYIELMNSEARISLKEKLDENKNKILYIAKDYSNFDDANCNNRLNIHLTNAQITSCTIRNGKIDVSWSGQALDKNDKNNNVNNNSFSYTLTAGQ